MRAPTVAASFTAYENGDHLLIANDQTGNSPSPAAQFVEDQIIVHTAGKLQLHDITDFVAALVRRARITAGIALIHSMHTTAGVLVNEGETGFHQDFVETVETLVPSNRQYRHDDLSVRWENICPEDRDYPNGHSHLQHSLVGTPSVVLPVRNLTLVLGRWQRLFVVEFDRPRERKIVLQAVGIMMPPERRDGHESGGDGFAGAAMEVAGAPGNRG